MSRKKRKESHQTTREITLEELRLDLMADLPGFVEACEMAKSSSVHAVVMKHSNFKNTLKDVVLIGKAARYAAMLKVRWLVEWREPAGLVGTQVIGGQELEERLQKGCNNS